MAVGDFFGNLKNKVRSVYNNFFYDGSEAPLPPMQEDYSRQEQPYAGQQQAASWQQNPPYGGQNAYQQPGYQPYQQQAYTQNAYQQPYGQNVYQQPAYAQPVQQQVQPQPQSAPQGRMRRAQQHAFQQAAGKVVDFGAYQQQNQQAAPNNEENAAEAAQQSGALLSARVINAHGMGDCRSAITLLRNGDAVLIVLENISDPNEMRRLVDTLSGACYSLTATITKVSRYGVYLLAPQTLAVFADQATNQMNSAPGRAQARPYQPAYGNAQRVTYAPQQRENPAQPHQPVQQQNPYAGMQGFTQRSAMQEEATQNFYQRPTPQAAQTTGFSAQPAGYGYAPDESAAMGQ